MTPPALPTVTAVVLAGGRATRMGGCDKGLQTLDGAPLIGHVLQRLQRQTQLPAAILISANRHLPDYRALGFPVWPDTVAGYPGPLAGALTGLAHCETPLLLTVPCDVPGFPATLCERLAAAIEASGADIAVAATTEPAAAGAQATTHLQPAFCLVRRHLHASLAQFLASGGRKVGQWIAKHAAVTVTFGPEPDDPWPAFVNINTRAELAQLESAGTDPGAAPETLR